MQTGMQISVDPASWIPNLQNLQKPEPEVSLDKPSQKSQLYWLVCLHLETLTDFFPLLKSLDNHRITWFGLEVILKTILFQTPAMGRDIFSQEGSMDTPIHIPLITPLTFPCSRTWPCRVTKPKCSLKTSVFRFLLGLISFFSVLTSLTNNEFASKTDFANIRFTLKITK